MSAKPLNLAISHIDGTGWTGGAVYLQNLMLALKSLEGAERPQISLLALEGNPAGYAGLRSLGDAVLTWPAAWSDSRLTARLSRRLRGTKGHWRRVERFLEANGINCLFGLESYGPGFGLPVLSWIPDFQHLHYPDMFSRIEIEQRNAAYAEAAATASRVVLSSRDALGDFARFSPASAGKGRVLSFVAHVPADIYDADPAGVCREYHLPERFFYLPNQFWKHKNHAVVIEALARLTRTAPDITVVCTGNTHDARNSGHFAGLLTEIARHGLRDRIILLGLVPHAHTFQLMRQSLAVLQPSLFEGWSTTVEEAKSVGKPLLLSSLAVHREQDPPESVYFDPRDPDALADALREVDAAAVPGPSLPLEAAARACLLPRTQAFGRTFLSIAREAAA